MSKFHGAKATYEAGRQFLGKLFGKKQKDSNKVAIRRLGSSNQDFKLFKDFLEEIKVETKPPDLV